MCNFNHCIIFNKVSLVAVVSDKKITTTVGCFGTLIQICKLCIIMIVSLALSDSYY